MNPDTITTETKNFIIDAGLNPDASFHSIRSGVASILANETETREHVIQAILGHADVRTTHRYYIKEDERIVYDAMSELNNLYES